MVFFYSLCLFLLIILHTNFVYLNPNKTSLRIVQRIYFAVEFSFISLFFSIQFRNKIVASITRILPLIFIIYVVLDYFTFDKEKLNFNILVIECLIFICYITYFFYEKMNSDNLTPLYQSYSFWVAVAFLFYSAGNFFLFLFKSTLVDQSLYQKQFATIYASFAIFKNIFLSVSMYIKLTPEVNSSNNKIEDNTWEIPNEYKQITNNP